MAEEQKRIGEITGEDVEALRRLTAYMLPNSPSAAGLPAEVVKKYFYQWLVDNKQSIVALINRIVGEINGAHEVLESDVGERLAQKLDKLPPESKKRVYTTDENGRPYSQWPVKYSMMWRDDKGASRVEMPTKDIEDTHIVNYGKLIEFYDLFNGSLVEIRNRLEQLFGIYETLPDASEVSSGFMSAEQYKQLETLVKLAGVEGNDENNFVSTIREVLEIFNEYPEAQNIFNVLEKKLDKSSASKTIYAIKKNGDQWNIPYSHEASDESIMSRDSNGRSRVKDPVNDLDIVNLRTLSKALKGFVGVSELKEKIDSALAGLDVDFDPNEIPIASEDGPGRMSAEHVKALKALKAALDDSDDLTDKINAILEVVGKLESEDGNLAQLISNKLDMSTETGSVYTTDTNNDGTTKVIKYGVDSIPGSIVQRDEYGDVKLGPNPKFVPIAKTTKEGEIVNQASVCYVNTGDGSLGTLPYSSTGAKSSVMTTNGKRYSKVKTPGTGTNKDTESEDDIINRQSLKEYVAKTNTDLSTKLNEVSGALEDVNSRLDTLESSSGAFFKTVDHDYKTTVPSNILNVAALKQVRAVTPPSLNLMPAGNPATRVLQNDFVTEIPESGHVDDNGIMYVTKSAPDRNVPTTCWNIFSHLLPGRYSLTIHLHVKNASQVGAVWLGLMGPDAVPVYNTVDVSSANVSDDEFVSPILSVVLDISKKGKYYLIFQGVGTEGVTNVDVRMMTPPVLNLGDHVYDVLGYGDVHYPIKTTPDLVIRSVVRRNHFNAGRFIAGTSSCFEQNEGVINFKYDGSVDNPYIICCAPDHSYVYTLSYDIDYLYNPSSVKILFTEMPVKVPGSEFANWAVSDAKDSRYGAYVVSIPHDNGPTVSMTFRVSISSKIGFAFEDPVNNPNTTLKNIRMTYGEVCAPYVQYTPSNLRDDGYTMPCIPSGHVLQDFDIAPIIAENPRLLHYNPYYPTECNYIDFEKRKLVFVGEMTADGEDWVAYDTPEKKDLDESVSRLIDVLPYGQVYTRFKTDAKANTTSTLGREPHPMFTVTYQKEVLLS